MQRTSDEVSLPPMPWVLMIEPVEEKGFAVRLSGEVSELWRTEVVTSVEALNEWAAKGNTPALIGFHATEAQLLSGRIWNPTPFYAELERLEWKSRTVLISGGQDRALEALHRAAEKQGYKSVVPRDAWVAYLEKRLSEAQSWKVGQSDEPEKKDLFARIAALVRRPNEQYLKIDWTTAVGLLNPAVMVLQEAGPLEAPTVILENDAAVAQPWERQDFRRWALLRKKLDALAAVSTSAMPSRAHLLDWDAKKRLPVECRLYSLGNGRYWYTRDWRVDASRAIDEVFAEIEAERSLTQRFDRLADYLAERWSISRLRLMEVALLPQSLGNLDQRGYWIECHQDTNGQTPSWLVVPRYQWGLGWPSDATTAASGSATEEARAPLDWWQSRYLWQDFVEADDQQIDRGVNQSQPTLRRQDVTPHLLGEKQQFVFETMKKPCKVSLSVDWGEAKTRLLVLVPQAAEHAEELNTLTQGTRPPRQLCALLAMDRRSNHLPGGTLIKRFTETEHNRIGLLKYGVIGEPLDYEVVQSMNHGALSAVRGRVGQWLADARLARAQRWALAIDSAVSETAGRGQGMAALSQLCDALLKVWPQLWRSEWERLFLDSEEPKGVPSLPNLSQLFLVVSDGNRRVNMPAGTGALWEYYQGQSSLPMIQPFTGLLASNVTPATWRIMQDFKAWWRGFGTLNKEFAGAAPHFQQTGSWAAMRLDSGPGIVPVLLVVHFNGEKNQIWLEVLQLLQMVADRLRAPFLLAWNEAHERAVWASSVVHEIKNMALLALADTEKLRENAALNVNGAVGMLVERLQQQVFLAQDFMYGLRPDLSPDQTAIEQAQQVDALGSIRAIVRVWQEDRPELEETKWQISATPDLSSLTLPAAQAWQRVVRVLLHNAYRHGENRVFISIGLKSADQVMGQPHLNLTLENGASTTALQLLRQVSRPEISRIPSAFVRRHMGLRAARALCELAQAQLDIRPTETAVLVTLRWPVAAVNTGVTPVLPLTPHSGPKVARRNDE